MIIFACISPHPPIILPNIGSPVDREKVKSTITALQSLAPKLAKTKPEIIIVSSPHPDWGIKVPLYFLIKNHNSRCVLSKTLPKWISIDTSGVTIEPSSNLTIYPILTTLDSPRQHYEWGKQIARSLPRAKRVAWIASGDLSHRLKVDGPYGLHPSGPKFDREFIERLKKKDIKGILNLDPKFVEEAGECGLRSFCMLLGALEAHSASSGQAWTPEILSYEGPFGVGYLVTNFKFYKIRG